jgi:hypothetical protein
MTSTKALSTVMLGAIASLSFAAPVFATSASDIRREALERREAAQEAAINQGRRDGGLTYWEKLKLNAEQKRIDRLEREALADGKITKKEYVDIKNAQSHAARHIESERNDGQVRGWWWRTFSR